jgi:ABC-2 type transport system ATP-binding protein
MPESDAHIPGMNAVSFVAYCGQLAGLPAVDAMQRAHEVLYYVGLGEARYRKIETYSTGMKQRIKLAQALVHDPDLVFLDEPTSGLDPQNRRAMWAELRRLCEEGTTIFLTTQYMEEADALCRRLAVIDQGRIVAEGSPSKLKARLGGEVLTLEFPTDDPDALRDLVARGALALQKVKGLQEVREGERVVVANLDGASAQVLPKALRALSSADVDARISVSTPTLDDVFLTLTGHALRDQESEKRASPWRRRR